MKNMEINVIVIPNAKVRSIIRIDNDHYKIKVDAKATEGKANMRLLEILAEHFGLPKSSIQIVKGAHSRTKIISLPNIG